MPIVMKNTQKNQPTLQLIQPLPCFTTGGCYSGTGRGYEGTINTTENGIPCQSWNSTYPHQHLLHLEGFGELEGGHNYCRNPGNRGERPWCFTTDRDVRWEYCDVPVCGKLAVNMLRFV